MRAIVRRERVSLVEVDEQGSVLDELEELGEKTHIELRETDREDFAGAVELYRKHGMGVVVPSDSLAETMRIVKESRKPTSTR